MRQIGQLQFPEPGNRNECGAWTPYIRRYALARNVLVVAKSRIEGSWKACCDAVPGEDHKEESAAVMRHGTEIPEEVARVMFPEFDEIPYAR